MILIVGLGNPGKKYEKTRHNVGFRVIDELAKNNNFPKFEFNKKFQAEISKDNLNGFDLILAKPQTFMNSSGNAVKSLVSYYKINPEKELLVIHDDIDITLGEHKISGKSGSGGHKGVESIIKNLAGKNFVRFRIGIKPKLKKPKSVETFVLQEFKKDEVIIKKMIEETAQAIGIFLTEGPDRAINKFNEKLKTGR